MARRPWRRHAIGWALAALLPLACGGGGGDITPGTVLFEGTAAELTPHETGRSARFRVTVRQGDTSDVSGFTTTVTRNDPDGRFVTRYMSDSGAIAEGTSHDSGDAIVVERFVNDPGGPAEEVAVPDPPVGVVRTPVVAGDAIESGFARTLELSIRVGDRTERRSMTFLGSARRVPVSRGAVEVADGTYDDAIRYQVEASGRARLDVLGESIAIDVEVSGDEWFAVGVGGVREDLEVQVRAGDERGTIRFTTERAGAPGG
jgi:hypothetical protein